MQKRKTNRKPATKPVQVKDEVQIQTAETQPIADAPAFVPPIHKPPADLFKLLKINYVDGTAEREDLYVLPVTSGTLIRYIHWNVETGLQTASGLVFVPGVNPNYITGTLTMMRR